MDHIIGYIISYITGISQPHPLPVVLGAGDIGGTAPFVENLAMKKGVRANRAFYKYV
jgi:hypothetical protein